MNWEILLGLCVVAFSLNSVGDGLKNIARAIEYHGRQK